MKKRTIFITIILLCLGGILFAQSPPKKDKPIRTGWYSYKMLVEHGFKVDMFKGKRFVRRTSDWSKVNLFKIKN